MDIFKKNFETKDKMTLHCLMSSTDLKSGEEITDVGFFSSLVEEVYEGTDLEKILDVMFARILENMANFTKGKSNWRFVQVNKLEIQVDEMSRDDGVGEWIPLPEILEKKKALINPQNKEDDECFKWCVTRTFFEPKIYPEKITDKLKEQSESFNWDKMSFPVEWKDITRFEISNGLSVNVFGWNNGKVYIARKAKRKRKRHVNLFMIKKNGKKHFCLISSMSRLLRKEKQKKQRYYCDNCLNSRQNEKALEKHKKFCESFEPCVQLPPKDDFMQFKNYKNQTSIPFRIYADSEAILKPVSREHGEFQEHIPCGFCFHTVAESGEEFSPVLIRGENCVDEFVGKLIEHVKQLQNKPKKPIIWEKGKREKFENQTHCWFCNEEIKGRKVADHCHFTGKFRGAAHVACNLNARKPKFTPVFFHNLFNYDIHHFVTALNKKQGKIKCIPNTEERYISLSLEIPVGKNEKGKVIKHEIKLLDSYKFMASPLDALVKNLEKDQLIQTKRIFGEKTDLLSRKGVYPYDWMDSFEKFEKVLPEKSDFFSKLNNEKISADDYQHACKVWKEFNMTNMGEYHDLYLKTDVSRLADVFENFRKPCLESYGLDPCWYLTAPAFAWDSMLKMTGVKMELLKDLDTHQFFETQIRGGVSTAFHRFAKANNKYMKDFDEKQPSNFLMYFDANSLYPTAMLEPLPLKEFKWLRKDKLPRWKEFLEQEGVGCVLRVDLEYPLELHDKHNDYPLAPESLKIDGVKKLILNLWDKKSMVLHAKNLHQYLPLGMKLKKIHRGIKFREEAFMKPFIELNTKLRTAAKNDFEKNFYKLQSNAVYGKTWKMLEIE